MYLISYSNMDKHIIRTATTKEATTSSRTLQAGLKYARRPAEYSKWHFEGDLRQLAVLSPKDASGTRIAFCRICDEGIALPKDSGYSNFYRHVNTSQTAIHRVRYNLCCLERR